MDLRETTVVRKKYAAPLPLDGLSFRIAILSPGSLDDILHMTLEVRSLEESDLNYEAISYCWSQGIGDTVEDTWDFEVKCDEVTINVPRNLGRALRRLRYRDRERRLWMDSICINQQNVEEKNCQVARMGQIFATATRVVVWLGEEDANTASAYGTIRLLAKAASVLAKQDEAIVRHGLLTKQVSEVAGLWPVSRNEIQAMADLLQRAWFERAWVYQESVLARETVVKTGSYEIAGSTVVSMAQGRRQYGMPYIGSKPENLLALDRACAMFLPLKTRSGFGSHFWQDLFWALRARRGAKTSDPRDVIYSLLGVVAGERPSLIIPDYNRSWQQLYIWVAKRIIEETHNLDILGELSPVPEALVDRKEGLPSWVPDWCAPLNEDTKFSGILNIKAGPKVRLFFSTGSSLVSLTGREDHSSHKLNVHGIHVATIESIQPSPCWQSWTEFFRFLTRKIYRPTQEPMPLACIKMLSLDASRWDPNHPNYVPNGYFDYVENYEDYLRGDTEVVDKKIMNNMARIRRKVVLTSGGYFGMAQDSVNVGDQVYLLPGAEFPVLLRRLRKEKHEYVFVGECFIHGLMNGQGMTIARKISDSTYNITLDDDSWLSKLHEKNIPLVMEDIIIC